MCYCPFADAHCESGIVKVTIGGPGQPSVTTGTVCEFWGGTDCRIRLVLELLEKHLGGMKTNAV
jgi:hypothetical protein